MYGVTSVDPQSQAAMMQRRAFIGGSDARIIMGNDEDALLRLWREKRGEVEPKDLSGNVTARSGDRGAQSLKPIRAN